MLPQQSDELHTSALTLCFVAFIELYAPPNAVSKEYKNTLFAKSIANGLKFFQKIFDREAAEGYAFYGFEANIFRYRQTVVNCTMVILSLISHRIVQLSLDQIADLVSIFENVLNVTPAERHLVAVLAEDIYFNSTMQGKSCHHFYNYLTRLFPAKNFLLKFLKSVCATRELANAVYVFFLWL